MKKPEPEDYPSDADIKVAADFVRACAAAISSRTPESDPTQSASTVRLVMDAAWKIRGNRERREDYEEATRRVAERHGGAPVEVDTFNP